MVDDDELRCANLRRIEAEIGFHNAAAARERRWWLQATITLGAAVLAAFWFIAAFGGFLADLFDVAVKDRNRKDAILASQASTIVNLENSVAQLATTRESLQAAETTIAKMNRELARSRASTLLGVEASLSEEDLYDRLLVVIWSAEPFDGTAVRLYGPGETEGCPDERCVAGLTLGYRPAEWFGTWQLDGSELRVKETWPSRTATLRMALSGDDSASAVRVDGEARLYGVGGFTLAPGVLPQLLPGPEIRGLPEQR